VKFLTGGETEPNFIRSGNPGYQTGKPVLIRVNADIQIPGFGLAGANSSGSCQASATPKSGIPLLNFREETIHTCTVALTFAEFQAYCSSGSNAAQTIFTTALTMTHIGKYGNAELDTSDDWVVIETSNTLGVNELSGNVCTLSNQLVINFYTIDVGSVANP
jgi:hypothetical protein